LKGGIVETEETVAGSHQLNKHVSAEKDMHATREEGKFPVWSIPRPYNWTG
jgi:hypothetical protein